MNWFCIWTFYRTSLMIFCEIFNHETTVNISQLPFSHTVLPGRCWVKKSLWHRCFPVNFAKFLKTPFFTERVRWLLLYFIIPQRQKFENLVPKSNREKVFYFTKCTARVLLVRLKLGSKSVKITWEEVLDKYELSICKSDIVSW